MMLATALQAGNANLSWDYNFVAEPSVQSFKLYSLPGSNSVFTANNANAFSVTLVQRANALSQAGVSNQVTTNLTATVSNLTAGWWTFTATAISTNAGLESLNSNSTNGAVRPGRVWNINVE